MRIFTTQGTRNKSKSIGLKVLTVFIWVLIWEIASIRVDQELLVPSVRLVLTTLFSLVSTTAFWQIAFSSIIRIVAGFALGTILGASLAVLTSVSKFAYTFFRPMLNVIKATPIVSFIILALVWIRNGNIPSFITFLMVFPIVWGNVYEGISQTDKKLLEMAKVYKFSRILILKKIYYYSVLPYLGAAATTSMGLAWKAGIAAEVIATPKLAIGTSIYNSKIYLETPNLFAWSIVVILMSVMLEKVVKIVLGKFVPSIRKDLKSETVSETSISEENDKEEISEIEISNKLEIGNEAETGNREKIIIEKLKVEYDDVVIIDNFNANLPLTGCVCVVGRSGAGKTTLFNTIAGLKKAAFGKIYISDSPAKALPDISYVFQDDRLIPWLTSLQNVEIVMKNKGTENTKSKAIDILTSVGLGDSLEKYPDELSGGMKVRVNIARAIAFDAGIVLLDEPFKGLDTYTKEKIVNIIKEIKKNKLVLLITHDKSDIDTLGDKVIEII